MAKLSLTEHRKSLGKNGTLTKQRFISRRYKQLNGLSLISENGSSRKAAQHSVHPTGGSLRVFRDFAWLEVGSGKMALSRPAHQRVTPAVRRFPSKIMSSVFDNFISGNGHVKSKETI